jgi:3D-(3,5/4)-trihydroxycyclohexane-1,2-dione acylhydrolase (decyclizing)
VIVLVGDGSYLMLHSELATIVAERIKVIIVLIDNQGYASIGRLSETIGSERFGTSYRYLDPQRLSFDTGDYLPVDLAANARSYGIEVTEIRPGPAALGELSAAIAAAKARSTATLIHITSDPLVYAPDGEGWWDVPVAEVSELESTGKAYGEYHEQRKRQRPLLG